MRPMLSMILTYYNIGSILGLSCLVSPCFVLSYPYIMNVSANAPNCYPYSGKILMCQPSSRNLIKPMPIKQSIKSSDCIFVKSYSELLTKMYFSSLQSNSSSSSLVSLYV